MGIIARSTLYFKKHGLAKTISRIIKGPDTPRVSQRDLYMELKKRYLRESIGFDSSAFCSHKDDSIKLLNWIIPDPLDGSGGHTTIFRFCSMLEERGFHSRVYCIDSRFSSDDELDKYVKSHFEVLTDSVEFFCDCSAMAFAHGTIATQWTTAYYLQHFNNTLVKFYFVQDYEPMFYPVGSEYVFAESTYSFGFHALTAGDWLKEIMTTKYDLVADSFYFSYDKQIYKPAPRNDDTKRVFFYARPTTPRRNFELGLLVLSDLANRMPEIEVVFAGGDLSNYQIDIPHYKSMGIASPRQLAETYAECDLCLVFSYTNLSLLPLEIMACGSVVVSSRGPNNEWMLNDDNSILVGNNPNEIVDTLEEYLRDADKLDSKRRSGMAYARSTDWNYEGSKIAHVIEMSISSYITGDGFGTAPDCEAC